MRDGTSRDGCAVRHGTGRHRMFWSARARHGAARDGVARTRARARRGVRHGAALDSSQIPPTPPNPATCKKSQLGFKVLPQNFKIKREFSSLTASSSCWLAAWLPGWLAGWLAARCRLLAERLDSSQILPNPFKSHQIPRNPNLVLKFWPKTKLKGILQFESFELLAGCLAGWMLPGCLAGWPASCSLLAAR